MNIYCGKSGRIRHRWTFQGLFLAALFLLTLASAPASAVSRSGWVEGTLRSGGLSRRYMAYVPENMPGGSPAVLLLHANRQGMRTMFVPGSGGTREWPLLAEREKFLLIVPNGTDPKTGNPDGERQDWNPSGAFDTGSRAVDDAAFISALLDDLVRRYRLDLSRIYATGQAGGGEMVYSLLFSPLHRFASVAVFSSPLPSGLVAGRGHVEPCPLMIVNGTEDPLLPWNASKERHSGETVMSAQASVGWWLVANHADSSGPRTELLPDADPRDGCRIFMSRYKPLPGGAPVLLYTVQGGGHAMPSRRHPSGESTAARRVNGRVCRDAEGAALAWEFMKDYRLPKR
jgi:polyhydroxybutyrate depolymerase